MEKLEIVVTADMEDAKETVWSKPVTLFIRLAKPLKELRHHFRDCKWFKSSL